MENITTFALIIISFFVIYWLFFGSNDTAEHLNVPATQAYVPANYQTVGNLNYLKLSDALYAPNMLSSSVLAGSVNTNNVNTGMITSDNIKVNNNLSVNGNMEIGGIDLKNTLSHLESTDSVTSELLNHLEKENSHLSQLVKDIQSEMTNVRPVYSASGQLSNSNLIQNIKFTNAWSAYPDDKIDAAEISNDVGNYKTLMIVGNKAKSQGKGLRTVGIWDQLDVNGQLNVAGGLSGTKKESVLDWVGNGIFRADKQNKLRDQYIMAVPGNELLKPTFIGHDLNGRGLDINTLGSGPITLNGRDIVNELNLIKAKINY